MHCSLGTRKRAYIPRVSEEVRVGVFGAFAAAPRPRGADDLRAGECWSLTGRRRGPFSLLVGRRRGYRQASKPASGLSLALAH